MAGAALVPSCFLGAFPLVDFLAVCFVRAIEMSGLGNWDLGVLLVSQENKGKLGFLMRGDTRFLQFL